MATTLLDHRPFGGKALPPPRTPPHPLRAASAGTHPANGMTPLPRAATPWRAMAAAEACAVGQCRAPCDDRGALAAPRREWPEPLAFQRCAPARATARRTVGGAVVIAAGRVCRRHGPNGCVASSAAAAAVRARVAPVVTAPPRPRPRSPAGRSNWRSSTWRSRRRVVSGCGPWSCLTSLRLSACNARRTPYADADLEYPLACRRQSGQGLRPRG